MPTLSQLVKNGRDTLSEKKKSQHYKETHKEEEFV